MHFRTAGDVRETVATVTMIRSLCHESFVSLMPNELLFQIFSFL